LASVLFNTPREDPAAELRVLSLCVAIGSIALPSSSWISAVTLTQQSS
jgi:hypothetical protein